MSVFLSLSKAFTEVLEYFKIALEYPPPPNVQSIYFPPLDGEEIFKTSYNITGKWDKSSDVV